MKVKVNNKINYYICFIVIKSTLKINRYVYRKMLYN